MTFCDLSVGVGGHARSVRFGCFVRAFGAVAVGEVGLSMRQRSSSLGVVQVQSIHSAQDLVAHVGVVVQSSIFFLLRQKVVGDPFVPQVRHLWLATLLILGSGRLAAGRIRWFRRT